MEIAVALIAVVLLTVAALAIARSGASQHQEDLNDHATIGGDGPPEDRAARTDDRPADADAEPMGVAEAGAPSVDPTSEQEATRAAGGGQAGGGQQRP